MKLPTFSPPSFRALRYLHLFATIICGGLVFLADNRWLAIMNAFLAGANFAAFCNAYMLERMRMHFDVMCEQFNAMSDLNEQLVTDKFVGMMQGGDEQPPRPRLH